MSTDELQPLHLVSKGFPWASLGKDTGLCFGLPGVSWGAWASLVEDGPLVFALIRGCLTASWHSYAEAQPLPPRALAVLC